jgi:hypothetical protein
LLLAAILRAFAGGRALLTLAPILDTLTRGYALTAILGALAGRCTLAPILDSLASSDRLALVLRPISAGGRGAALLTALSNFAAVTLGFGTGADTRTGLRPRLPPFGSHFGPGTISGGCPGLPPIGAHLGPGLGSRRRPGLAAAFLLILGRPAAILILGDGRYRYGHRGGAGEQ